MITFPQLNFTCMRLSQILTPTALNNNYSHNICCFWLPLQCCSTLQCATRSLPLLSHSECSFSVVSPFVLRCGFIVLNFDLTLLFCFGCCCANLCAKCLYYMVYCLNIYIHMCVCLRYAKFLISFNRVQCLTWRPFHGSSVETITVGGAGEFCICFVTLNNVVACM